MYTDKNKEQENKLLSQTISWLRFPLILLVVFIHCPGFPTIEPWIEVSSPQKLQL